MTFGAQDVGLQMVDKIWFDWQHRHPLNANSFFGGSVLSLESLEAFEQYPNGAPPYLSVSTLLSLRGRGTHSF
jgi:tyrosinase